ncbi:unnamed protein product [Cyclocybe aegerita]|uniref:Uncharacterized protein n=1 Tax=Cyclocybe aegerita TaxID=1973307 RepID=A0A8S0W4Q5_CYCAE|nr:unnamed protein product [Cyclocybe aegerita]
MTYSHISIFPHAKDQYHYVQGRVYQTFGPKPRFVKVPTHDNGTRRFAFLQGILKGRIQQHVHTCEVKVIDRQSRSHLFYIFFKNHCHLPTNWTVLGLSGRKIWNGDIVILHASATSDGVVNMRGKDAKLADFALKRY